MTEKVFDALRAGCVPVYLGPANAFDYFDEGAVVNRARFHSDHALGDYLASVDQEEWESIRAAGRAYLSSKRYERFLPPAFADTLNRALDLR